MDQTKVTQWTEPSRKVIIKISLRGLVVPSLTDTARTKSRERRLIELCPAPFHPPQSSLLILLRPIVHCTPPTKSRENLLYTFLLSHRKSSVRRAQYHESRPTGQQPILTFDFGGEIDSQRMRFVNCYAICER